MAYPDETLPTEELISQVQAWSENKEINTIDAPHLGDTSRAIHGLLTRENSEQAEQVAATVNLMHLNTSRVDPKTFHDLSVREQHKIIFAEALAAKYRYARGLLTTEDIKAMVCHLTNFETDPSHRGYRDYAISTMMSLYPLEALKKERGSLPAQITLFVSRVSSIIPNEANIAELQELINTEVTVLPHLGLEVRGAGENAIAARTLYWLENNHNEDYADPTVVKHGSSQKIAKKTRERIADTLPDVPDFLTTIQYLKDINRNDLIGPLTILYCGKLQNLNLHDVAERENTEIQLVEILAAWIQGSKENLKQLSEPKKRDLTTVLIVAGYQALDIDRFERDLVIANKARELAETAGNNYMLGDLLVNIPLCLTGGVLASEAQRILQS
ncbi:hypothetical protein GW755_00385 [bacterium]|nr:hypothetical protein [bacterium]